jgi:hypothetical protein
MPRKFFSGSRRHGGKESCVCLYYCEYSKLPPEGRGCRAEDGIETASPATEILHSIEKILKNAFNTFIFIQK